MARAIRATLERRKTAVPTALPDALTADFANDATKQRQWEAFIAGIEAKPGTLSEVVDALAEFLMPHAEQAGGSDHQ